MIVMNSLPYNDIIILFACKVFVGAYMQTTYNEMILCSEHFSYIIYHISCSYNIYHQAYRLIKTIMVIYEHKEHHVDI